MAQPDLIGVNERWFNVTLTAAANDPALRRKMLARLDVMRREAEHVIRAISVMRLELSKPKPFPSHALAHAFKQARDWVLSVVISEAYLISMNLMFVRDPPPPSFEILFIRAAAAGVRQAVSDPERRAWVHSNSTP